MSTTSNTNIFALVGQACFMQLKFETSKGYMGVEKLLSEESETFFNNLADNLQAKVDSTPTRNRFQPSSNPELELNKMRLQIVEGIIDQRVKAKEAASIAKDVKKHNQEILDLIKEKENEARKDLSVDELRALLK